MLSSAISTSTTKCTTQKSSVHSSQSAHVSSTAQVSFKSTKVHGHLAQPSQKGTGSEPHKKAVRVEHVLDELELPTPRVCMQASSISCQKSASRISRVRCLRPKFSWYLADPLHCFCTWENTALFGEPKTKRDIMSLTTCKHFR